MRVESHKLVRASDDHSHLGVIGIDAATHTYHDWLTGTVEECVGDEAQIASAGMLRNRAQAWVQIMRPEVSHGPGGVRFSPYIGLSTSLDASWATLINRATTLAICDNTARLMREQGIAFKHTSGSGSKLGVYRSVMTALLQGEEDFKAVLDHLLAEDVPEQAFGRFLDKLVPVADEDSKPKKTRALRKKQEITQLYRNDPRVSPWEGTAFGVIQAVNTWETHERVLRNTTGIELSDTDLRAMRGYETMLRAPKGPSTDEQNIALLEAVLV
jgi:phage/plasmid-like protein (TIGR03299 family)